MGRKETLAKNTLLLSLGTIMTKGLSFVMVPIFSRWLTTSDYGTFDLLCTYVTLLLPIIGLATQEALFRFSMDVNGDQEKKVYVSNCICVFAINTILFFGIACVLKISGIWDFALLFFFLAFGEILNLYLQGFLRAIKKLNIYSFVSAITTVFIAIFTTIFVWLMDMGLQGIILGYGCGYLAGDLIIIAVTRYWNYFSCKFISVSEIKKLVKYSYALIPNSLAWWFINVSDRTIINIFLGAAANGIYAIAYKIPNILSAVFSVFSISWQQSATEALNDKDRNDFFNNIYNRLIVTLLSLCCGILSVNFLLFKYIFDARYVEGHLYAPILIGGTVFATISQFYGSIQISFKQPKENGITTVIGAVSNLIIHLALVKFVGLYAAAISTILSQVVVCVLRNVRLKRMLSLKITGRTLVMFGIYVYYSVCAFIINNTVLNIVNLGLSCILVLIVNKAFLQKFLRKLK